MSNHQLSRLQIDTLLEMVVNTHHDDFGCEDCFEELASFADAKLARQSLPAALVAVESHLKQCACCRDEYETLQSGLQALSSH